MAATHCTVQTILRVIPAAMVVAIILELVLIWKSWRVACYMPTQLGITSMEIDFMKWNCTVGGNHVSRDGKRILNAEQRVFFHALTACLVVFGAALFRWPLSLLEAKLDFVIKNCLKSANMAVQQRSEYRRRMCLMLLSMSSLDTARLFAADILIMSEVALFFWIYTGMLQLGGLSIGTIWQMFCSFLRECLTNQSSLATRDPIFAAIDADTDTVCTTTIKGAYNSNDRKLECSTLGIFVFYLWNVAVCMLFTLAALKAVERFVRTLYHSSGYSLQRLVGRGTVASAKCKGLAARLRRSAIFVLHRVEESSEMIVWDHAIELAELTAELKNRRSGHDIENGQGNDDDVQEDLSD